MAHLHKKMKKGRPYYYIREIARVNGKPTVVSQVYLGSPERMLELASGTGGEGKVTKLKSEEFGALWLANHIDQKIGLVGLIDEVVPKAKDKGETGPSVGEYFLYAVFNRMIDTCSKRGLPDWYRDTAIQQIRPVAVDELNSQRYWDKWERLDEQSVSEVARRFFRKLAELEPPSSDCFLFDTTNYFTFMASDTESELCKRGNNKEGRHWLRQVGLALLVSRDNQLPFFYREYEGNCHDSKLFLSLVDTVIASMQNHAAKPGNLTIVFDKGMNSDDNIAAIDDSEGINFITCYSPYFAPKLIHVRLDKFAVADTTKNQELINTGQADDALLAWRTTGQYWGKERTVVVTYNPKTARKQRYVFEDKLLKLETALFTMRDKVRKGERHWKAKKSIEERYQTLCEDLHLPKDLYNLDIEMEQCHLVMRFRKDYYRIGKHCDKFGKNILITDNSDWETGQIVQASLDRYMVEKSFRNSKDADLIGVMPLRHWTDSKIRCHILTCIIALSYLRLIELTMKKAGAPMSASVVMENMHRLHSCLLWQEKQKTPGRMIEEPTELQAQILKTFGYAVTTGGVLQKVT
jgi:transposase